MSGNTDGFVTRIDTNGGALRSSVLLGGSGAETAEGVAVDAAGQVYVVGSTGSHTFPTTTGVLGDTHGGGRDVFVGKFSADGRDLLYATFLGGAEEDLGHGIAVDAAGNVTLTGETASVDFPVTEGVFNGTHQGGADVFVARLNAAGNALLYSTFVGGPGNDRAHALGIDDQGRTVVTGQTFSSTFPRTEGVFSAGYNGNGDAFVFRLNNDGSMLDYAGFLGGAEGDIGWDLALDGNGNAHVVGETVSGNFPVTEGAYDTTHNGVFDGFAVKITDDGTTLAYGTYLGGSQSDYGYATALDSSGNAYVAGMTFSPDFPVTEDAFETIQQGDRDGWVAKLDAGGSNLAWCTFLGSEGRDFVNGITVDGTGSAVVTGETNASSFPVTPNGFDSSYGGSDDVFVTRLSAGGDDLLYSTYLGGIGNDRARDVADTGDGNAVVVGFTDSAGYPTNDDGWQTGQGGFGDAFVTKLCMAVPDQPGAVIGPALVCADETGVTYSIPAMDGVSGYVWDIPFWARITSGQGSPEITVAFGPVGGDITVYAHNDCGPGLMQVFPVAVTARLSTPRITGSPVICANDADVIFTVSPVSDAYWYQWTVPAGAQITAGQGTTAVSVTFGAEGGEVSVAAVNECGVGPGERFLVGLLDEIPVTVADTPRFLCPGASTTLTASTADAKTVTHQWFQDEVPLPGETRGSLVVSDFDAADSTRYHCEVTGSCGTFESNVVMLVRDSLQQAALTPTGRVQTTEPAVFDLRLGCSQQDLSFAWTTTPPTSFVDQGSSIIIDPAPTETTRIDVTITDTVNGSQATDYAWLLVPAHDGFDDFNGDGCRNVQDLWQLAQSWLQPFENDPNDDGVIDVRDLLYLALVDLAPCSD